jgi:UTP--glucose-1-phosphate uridylyltransferase
MLPVVDKPLIQYAVEEAVAAGITDLIFVTGRGKRSIEDHFDHAYELESTLTARGRNDLVEQLRAVVPAGVSFSYVRQSEPLGLGHAVLCARPLVGDDAFAVVLADDLIHADKPVLQQMSSLYARHLSSVAAVMPLEADERYRHGVVAVRAMGIRLHEIRAMSRRPAPADALSPLSHFAVVGRYIFTPAIFHHLDQVLPDADGEINLAPAIERLAAEEAVLAYEFSGTRYDCGSKLGYLQATVAYGLRHAEVGAAFAAFLQAAARPAPVGRRSVAGGELVSAGAAATADGPRAALAEKAARG